MMHKVVLYLLKMERCKIQEIHKIYFMILVQIQCLHHLIMMEVHKIFDVELLKLMEIGELKMLIVNIKDIISLLQDFQEFMLIK